MHVTTIQPLVDSCVAATTVSPIISLAPVRRSLLPAVTVIDASAPCASGAAGPGSGSGSGWGPGPGFVSVSDPGSGSVPAVTLICLVAVAVAFVSVVTVSRTVYVPGVVLVWGSVVRVGGRGDREVGVGAGVA